ncbi:MAG: hypothetical protein QW743_06205 [Candidatus Methanomethylicia archaeon]
MDKVDKNSIWTSEPLELVIMSLLYKAPKKAFDETELYDKIKQSGSNFSYNQFIKALIKLELWGKINVSSGRKGQKIISLAAG